MIAWLVNTSWSFPHSWLITRFLTRLTQRMPLVEQKLLTLQEHLKSHPVFEWSSCYSIFSFMCMFCRSLFCLFFLAVSYCHHFSSVVRPSTFHILIFSSETTGPIATKLWWNGPWMAPFQNCVRWSWLPTKMATKLKIEKKGGWNFNCPLLLWYKSKWAQILTAATRQGVV
jgi:hypothetical protein